MDGLTGKPFVVGIGGSGSPGSVTEWALTQVLAAAEQMGAEVRMFDGAFLGAMPLFQPHRTAHGWAELELLDGVTKADGMVLASPSYHGGVSALVKNALDYLEHLRDAHRPYLDGRAVGCLVTSAGYQAGGTTLGAMRAIVHALRGWPTPFGVTLNSGDAVKEPDQTATQLRLVATQVVEFARTFAAARGSVGVPQ
jgi:FMN reductase